MDLEARIKRLERSQNTWRLLCLLLVLVMVIAAGTPTSSKILLESPNKKFKIQLIATDEYAGIWINGDPSGSMVAITNDGQKGSVVGVFGPKIGGRWKSMDAAITANQDGGYLMLADPLQKDFKFLTGK
jgi:hypothetical protein